MAEPCVVDVAVFIGVPVAEFFLLSFWADPLHSVTLAKKGCSDPKLVSAHTSPFAGIMRNGGPCMARGSLDCSVTDCGV